MSDDLWAEASADHDLLAREAALARAEAGLDDVIPFLLAARSPDEYAHRSYLAQESIRGIAARSGVDADELMAVARRRYDLYREALMEGTDPLAALEPLLNGAPGAPERALEHEEGPDFSGGYSEVPAGPLGGPDPRVTAPRPPAMGPVQQAAGSLRRQGAGSGYMPVPPDTGTGSGSLDTGMPSAATDGLTPSLPAGAPQASAAPLTPPSIGQVTSGADPVRRRVMQVTAMISRSNPQLPAGECERLGRVVVGRYLATADLDDSVMNNGPAETGGGSGSGGSHDGGGGAAQHMLEGQGLRSMLPGLGGGAGGAAGAGGAGAELAEGAALLAL